LALKAKVPLLPGTGLLSSVSEAIAQAETIGYPVMLKSTAGGGGIGMKLCHTEEELSAVYESVQRLGASNFSNDGVFLEKAIVHARHIEVQVFGDGQGCVVSLGERDCSAQRRNQKVVEECPAPNLTAKLRQQLSTTAERLLESVNYRNAGTVEFLVDAQTSNPFKDFRPCPGVLTDVSFPAGEGIRVDHWLEPGIVVPPYFDPMLAKLITFASSRDVALQRLQKALKDTSLAGSETNLSYLRSLCESDVLKQGLMTTRYLDSFEYKPTRMDVVRSGTMTTIQDLPGRVGYWSIGVPPSGPFDSRSFDMANALLGNPAGCAGLECTLDGPALCFSSRTLVVVAGAPVELLLDDTPVGMWTVLQIEPGQTLSIGRLGDKGARAYLCVAGGIQCPQYLGSRSTFTLGKFGGHNGSALTTGDVLQLDEELTIDNTLVGQSIAEEARPEFANHWTVQVMHGPHSAPDFFTVDDVHMLFDTHWQVHYNSSRTGVRLIGPTPQWAREDGGEAGLHPSNIHDNAYAFGSVDFTGDMPVILGPDGPSLGGFVCPTLLLVPAAQKHSLPYIEQQATASCLLSMASLC